MTPPARFEVVARNGRARAGVLHTAHGPVLTPAFLPVATQASVKGLAPAEVAAVGTPGLLVNAYHLWLRPGPELIQRAGGLHRFMGWDRPIITDSGGFQVFSLGGLVEETEAGVTFQSHLSGEVRGLTPELAVEVQAALGADVAMVLDICVEYPAPAARVRLAAERTLRWAERSVRVGRPPDTQLFAIVQGGTDLGLRRWCAEQLAGEPFDGFGIGGLSVGEPRTDTWPALEAALDVLPEHKPRYLMGVGAPRDLLEAVARGVDLFDCVLPTRLGRHGAVLSRHGKLNLHAERWAAASQPIDPLCVCPACSTLSMGVVHHLLRQRDSLGMALASLHNIRYLVGLMEEARQAILEGAYPEFCAERVRGRRDERD